MFYCLCIYCSSYHSRWCVRSLSPPAAQALWSALCKNTPYSLASCCLSSCSPAVRCQNEKTTLAMNQQDILIHSVYRCSCHTCFYRGVEMKLYLMMMLLSYSSPSGVCMIAYSWRVTSLSAGLDNRWVTWSITRGSSLVGDRTDREPTAFWTAYKKDVYRPLTSSSQKDFCVFHPKFKRNVLIVAKNRAALKSIWLTTQHISTSI